MCEINNCSGKMHARGWCNKHYRRWIRHGNPEITLIAEHGKYHGCNIGGCKEKHAGHGYCAIHYRQAFKVKATERYREWKARAIEKLGGICVRCGFDDERALQFDHINDDGYTDRKNPATSWGYSHYRNIALEIRTDIQLLCANCNWIKRSENDELSTVRN